MKGERTEVSAEAKKPSKRHIYLGTQIMLSLTESNILQRLDSGVGEGLLIAHTDVLSRAEKHRGKTEVRNNISANELYRHITKDSFFRFRLRTFRRF